MGSPNDRDRVASLVSLLAPIGGVALGDRLDGSDIEPLVKAGGVPALSLDIDQHQYFFTHHTSADTVDKVDPQQMAKVIAGLTTLAFIAADMPRPLDHVGGQETGSH